MKEVFRCSSSVSSCFFTCRSCCAVRVLRSTGGVLVGDGEGREAVEALEGVRDGRRRRVWSWVDKLECVRFWPCAAMVRESVLMLYSGR